MSVNNDFLKIQRSFQKIKESSTDTLGTGIDIVLGSQKNFANIINRLRSVEHYDWAAIGTRGLIEFYEYKLEHSIKSSSLHYSEKLKELREQLEQEQFSKEIYQKEKKKILSEKQNDNDILTIKEQELFHYLTNKKEYFLHHTTSAETLENILSESNPCLQDPSELNRNGIGGMPRNYGFSLTDNVFFGIGSKTSSLPAFTTARGNFSSVFVSLNKLLENSKNSIGIWGSGHFYHYLFMGINSNKSKPVILGNTRYHYQHFTTFPDNSTARNTFENANLRKSLIFVRDNGQVLRQCLNYTDEIIYGKKIIPFLALILIERLRLVGGSFREQLLDSPTDEFLINHALEKLLRVDDFEVHIPAKLDLNKNYVTIADKQYRDQKAKQVIAAVQAGDIDKLEKLKLIFPLDGIFYQELEPPLVHATRAKQFKTFLWLLNNFVHSDEIANASNLILYSNIIRTVYKEAMIYNNQQVFDFLIKDGCLSLRAWMTAKNMSRELAAPAIAAANQYDNFYFLEKLFVDGNLLITEKGRFYKDEDYCNNILRVFIETGQDKVLKWFEKRVYEAYKQRELVVSFLNIESKTQKINMTMDYYKKIFNYKKLFIDRGRIFSYYKDFNDNLSTIQYVARNKLKWNYGTIKWTKILTNAISVGNTALAEWIIKSEHINLQKLNLKELMNDLIFYQEIEAMDRVLRWLADTNRMCYIDSMEYIILGCLEKGASEILKWLVSEKHVNLNNELLYYAIKNHQGKDILDLFLNGGCISLDTCNSDVCRLLIERSGSKSSINYEQVDWLLKNQKQLNFDVNLQLILNPEEESEARQIPINFLDFCLLNKRLSMAKKLISNGAELTRGNCKLIRELEGNRLIVGNSCDYVFQSNSIEMLTWFFHNHPFSPLEHTDAIVNVFASKGVNCDLLRWLKKYDIDINIVNTQRKNALDVVLSEPDENTNLSLNRIKQLVRHGINYADSIGKYGLAAINHIHCSYYNSSDKRVEFFNWMFVHGFNYKDIEADIRAEITNSNKHDWEEKSYLYQSSKYKTLFQMIKDKNTPCNPSGFLCHNHRPDL